MSDLPSVSVIIPAFRQADFIDACLDSVAAQSWEGPLEVVVIDDESPDDVGGRARNHPLKPRVIRQLNRGVAGARNRGIRETTGTWVAFLDADDRWTEDHLTRHMEALQAGSRPALSFSRYRRVTPAGEPLSIAPEHPAVDLKPSARRLLIQNFIGTSTVVAHRECLTRAGGFPDTPELRRAGQDYALWLRIAAYFPLVYVPHVGVLYTVHADNRVGVDPVRHHSGGLYALAELQRWEPDRFRSLSATSLNALIARRTGRFLLDTLRYRERFPPGSARQALEVSLGLLRR